MKTVSLIFLIFVFSHDCNAQFSRFIIRLKDKAGTPFSLGNPASYLSQRAIDRRTRYGIAIDSTDLPVNSGYVNQIASLANLVVLNVSKWLNAVTIQTSDPAALAAVNALPFVISSAPIAAKLEAPGAINSKLEGTVIKGNNEVAKTAKVEVNFYDYGASSFNEIHLHNGEFLHNIGLRGDGMEIAILDNGFNNYTSASFHAFDSVNARHQVLGTWDFVAREQDVTNDGNHGMSCFSTIAGNIPGQFIGKAPEAGFWLYQTEDNSSEFPIEEVNWACGAERADSSGADVISSSLGYSLFDSSSLNHSYSDMNGNATLAAIAADLAAKKGMLVFIANGNEGGHAWHFLTTPADGDSVIGVGAVDVSGVVGSFSSYGPSSDGQVKPDLASIGVSAFLQTSGGGLGFESGTSFACPNMAGLSTCLWQAFPEFNNMSIRAALWASGSIATSPDDRIGYGIPDMKKAFMNLLINYATANGSISNCKSTLNWTSKDVSSMSYEIERKLQGESNFVNLSGVSSDANTNVLAIHSYQFTDSLVNAQAGTVSYRIRQLVDTAGASLAAAYIDTVNLNLANSCVTTGINPVNPNQTRVTIIPNPVHDQFTLKVESVRAIAHLAIRVIDFKGTTILQFNRSKGTGIESFDLPVHQLPAGKYTVLLYDGDHFLESEKLIRL